MPSALEGSCTHSTLHPQQACSISLSAPILGAVFLPPCFNLQKGTSYYLSIVLDVSYAHLYTLKDFWVMNHLFCGLLVTPPFTFPLIFHIFWLNVHLLHSLKHTEFGVTAHPESIGSGIPTLAANGAHTHKTLKAYADKLYTVRAHVAHRQTIYSWRKCRPSSQTKH